MQKFQFVTVDTILAKYSRDFRGLDVNIDDAIEWVGEALGFIKIPSASEEAVAFLQVKNYQAAIPAGLHYILQIARNNNYPNQEISHIEKEINIDLNQPLRNDVEDLPKYTPNSSIPLKYAIWSKSTQSKDNFSPVRLADSSFFNSLVCKELNNSASMNEYTIVQDNFRFSFKEGFVAVAFIRQMIDCHTGYPMIPDDESAKAAITYYLGWKFKERECWNHREGACQLSDRAEQHWLKYVKQFKSKAKMPTGLDQHQNLLENAFSLIPNHRKYYGFFGKTLNNNNEGNYINNNSNFTKKDPEESVTTNITNVTKEDDWDSVDW